MSSKKSQTEQLRSILTTCCAESLLGQVHGALRRPLLFSIFYFVSLYWDQRKEVEMVPQQIFIEHLPCSRHNGEMKVQGNIFLTDSERREEMYTQIQCQNYRFLTDVSMCNWYATNNIREV